MYIYGEFVNQLGETVSVHILTQGDRTQTMEIGDESADIYFGDDPVEITSEVNDTFDVLLRQSATITLLCGNLVSDFFSTSCRGAVVNIYKAGVCVFAGFIEPQTFSQSYNERWDELSLNCIDALSALQYSNYRKIGTTGVDYSTIKADAGQRAMQEIVVEILSGVHEGLDIVKGGDMRLWYDGSRAMNSLEAKRYTLLDDMTISELLFLGDEEDDVWQQDEVLEAILKYPDLHIAQDGLDFYIFSWQSVKSADAITWKDLMSTDTLTTERKTVEISLDNVADCDTTISIGDVYNQMILTCDVEDMEDLIESPLDDDDLTNPCVCKQKYLTEYSCDGEGVTAFNAFYALTHDQTTDYSEGEVTDWYIRIKQHPHWTFPQMGDESTDLVGRFCSKGTNQDGLLDWLGQSGGACIVSAGSVAMNSAKSDNSPVSKVSMSNYLVVAVNGNEKDSEGEAFPTAEYLKKWCPVAVYTGGSAGAVLSPTDIETTNYIVISGKVILNPVMNMTNTYTNLNTKTWTDPSALNPGEIDVWHKTVPSRNNDDGRYYTRKYLQATDPTTTPVWHKGFDSGFYPYTGAGPEQYEFAYSAIGDSTDRVSKVAVLACMLVVGDKCVVETGAQGLPSDYVWRDYKERSACASEEEYYSQCFTIGFDPKIGDKLIGTEYDIQNNIDYTMNVDAEGTAIPIRCDEDLSGKVQFKILGPVNVLWDNVEKSTKRTLIFFKHTEWNTTSVPLMAHVSSIQLKEFEVKLYSDNGLVDGGTTDNDIVYMSDTEEKFVNPKDDLKFKISSALSTEECRELGVANTVKMSTPVNRWVHYGIGNIYDRMSGETVKPEQMYVNNYYNEYHEPRIEMEQGLNDKSDVIGLFNHYRHNALGKDFFVEGISRTLVEGNARLTLKEIDQ